MGDNGIDNYLNQANTAAKQFGVVPDVHRYDFIFKFLIENPSFPDVDSAINYYFFDGNRSMLKLKSIMHDICHLEGKSINLL